MSKVLSLKWRPKKFSELEGQSSVKQILTNALKLNSIHPAFIFSGPKGTGKTSTARIFAKALRCQNREVAEPCNRCPLCINVQNSNDVDVIEIDGASNNGVDAIRSLKESVQYMPSSSNKRIYIIDEVHMLSQSAFNALLKTLEEPPAHVIFILATTEMNKIPKTVISRCQTLYFKPIAESVIQKKLQLICKEEGIQIDEEALWLIVQQSQNSMRDAQVLLDQMACLGNQNISANLISQSLGLTSRVVVNSVLEAIVQKDTQKILSVISELSSVDAYQFLNQLFFQVRNLLIIQLTGGSNQTLVFLPDSEKKHLQKLSNLISTQETHQLFDMCLQGRDHLTKSFDAHIALEMILIRMSQASDKDTPSASIPSNKRQTHHKPSPSIPSKLSKETPPVVKNVQSSPVRPSIKKVAIPSGGNKDSKSFTSNAQKNWSGFKEFIRTQNPKLATYVKNFSVESLTDNQLVLSYPESLLFLKEKIKEPTFQDTLQKYITQFFGGQLKFQFMKNHNESVYTKNFNENHQRYKKNLEKAQSEPLAQKVTDLFQAQVVADSSVRPSPNKDW